MMENFKSEKLHCLAGANPFHNGHVALLRRGLENAAGIDINIGRKTNGRPERLPWETRFKATSIALERMDIHDRVSILTGTMKEVLPEEYNGALMGLNLLSTLLGLSEKKMYQREIEWFKRFKRIVVVNNGEFSHEILGHAKKNVSKSRHI